MANTSATGGPGRYFADRPTIYRLSLAGSTATAVYAAVQALRESGARRIPWTALALLEAAITAGVISARRQRAPRGGPSKPAAPKAPARS